jgi:hypothetical protein
MVLARDIQDIRGIVGSKYNQGMLKLLKYYRESFPGFMAIPNSLIRGVCVYETRNH